MEKKQLHSMSLYRAQRGATEKRHIHIGQLLQASRKSRTLSRHGKRC